MNGVWLILVVLAVLVCGGLIAWVFLARRPTKLDPRHERIVQALVQLQRENPTQAAEIVARALVRGGLVWESDLPHSDEEREEKAPLTRVRVSDRTESIGNVQVAKETATSATSKRSRRRRRRKRTPSSGQGESSAGTNTSTR